MKPVRLRKMEQYILEKGFVSLDDLCEYFGVSKNTIRADVAELVERGVASKKYGGVEANTTGRILSSFSERRSRNIRSKQNIGRCAAELLEEGDVIYVDSGTTTSEIFTQGLTLPDGITVITNNLMVVNQYDKYSNITFIMLPGKLNPNTQSFTDLETIDFFSKYNISKAFLATTGISLSGGLTNSTPIEAKLKEIAVEISGTTILMADSTKLARPAMINFANLDAVDIWICDGEMHGEVEALCRTHGVKLVTATDA